MNINKRSVLITGGSRGIGFGIAKQFAAMGYNLVINGLREESEIKDKISELQAFGIQVVYARGNIGEENDRTSILRIIKEKFKTINVLVNNAGVSPLQRKDILEMNEESFDHVIDTNLKGTFFLTQQIAREMEGERKVNEVFKGCIINITSISADVASIDRGEYCMSKAGLSMMTKLIAARMGKVGIPVYEIRPGIIETDMTSGVKEKYNALFERGVSIESRWGQPEDIGKIAVSLAEGLLPYSTGQVIYADGGMHVRRL